MIGINKRIVFFGECMREHRADGTESFGGDTFNTAWYFAHALKRYGESAVFYASAFGHCDASKALFNKTKTANINTDFIVFHPTKQLGEYRVHLTAQGERTFSFNRDNSAAREYFELPETLTVSLKNNSVDVIYLSGISLAILNKAQRDKLLQTLQVFKQGGGMVVFDNNFRPTLWQLDDPKNDYFYVMALADIAFLTDEDEYQVYGTKNTQDIIALHLKDKSQKQLLVIRQGANPCVVFDNISQSALHIPAKHLEPELIKDTCAAGDSFAAGFLAQYFLGNPLEQCAKYAHLIASTVIQYQGALIEQQQIPKICQQESSTW